MNPHDIHTITEAKAAGWTFYGPEEDQTSLYTWHRVQKAVFEDNDCRIVMVTRRMLVDGGSLWQTHTQTTTFGEVEMEWTETNEMKQDRTTRRKSFREVRGITTSESLAFQPTSA